MLTKSKLQKVQLKWSIVLFVMAYMANMIFGWFLWSISKLNTQKYLVISQTGENNPCNYKLMRKKAFKFLCQNYYFNQ